MAETLTPTSELGAVNVCLQGIDEAPVSTLTGEVIEDVAIALSTIRNVSRSVQTKGWGFNTEIEFPLPRDSDDDTVSVPANCVRVKISTPGVDCVQRGVRLYDRIARSYAFGADLEASEMVILLPFEELPEAVRWYITVSAQRTFVANVTGSESHLRMSERAEVDARSTMIDAEADTENSSIFDSPDMRRAQRNVLRPRTVSY